MRTPTTRTLAVAAALLASCGGGGHELRFGAAVAPTLEEQAAVADAQTTLQAGAAGTSDTAPTAGSPGLADQLAASLGASGGTPVALLSSGGPQARNALARATSLPASALALDPACATVGETSITWAGCVVSDTQTDPSTGDVTTLTVHLDGRFGWSPATGQTTWSIVERMAMATTGVDPMSIDAVVRLDGDLTFGAATIKGHTSSAVDATMRLQGITMSEAVTTTLAADLGYAASPFCVTSGTLTVAQVWSRRPMGLTRADLPDQGWRFEWTGCGAFTVAHGS